ncbi:MAG: hypothetical protein JSS07_11275 [Proteobacteria bacterium]|nr:hypothetical protein [Pseudomonadota bacterium]
MKKVLYRIYKIGGWACITTACFLVLMRVGMPFFIPNMPNLSQWVTKQIPYPTSIQSIKFDWQGYHPILILSEVAVFSEDKKACALQIQKLKIRLNVLQLFLQKLQVDELSLEGAVGGLDYQNGVISVSKLQALQFNLLKRPTLASSLKNLVIKDSALHFTVNQEKVFYFSRADLQIETASTIKISASAALKSDQPQVQGFLALKAWLKVKSPSDISLVADFWAKDIFLQPQTTPVNISKIQGQWQGWYNGQTWEVSTDKFEIEEDSQTSTWQFALKQAAAQKITWKLVGKDIDIKRWQNHCRQFELLPELPLFDGKGNIDYLALNVEDQKGQLILQSNNVALDYQSYFAQPLSVKDLSLVLDWHKLEDIIFLNIENLQAKLQEVPLKSQGTLSFIAKKPQSADIIFSFGSSTIEALLSIMPQKIMDKELTHWLTNALSTGDHLSTKGLLRGNFADFPFDNAQGIFEIHTELDKLDFNYNKPYWPALTDLKANLHFHNRALFIDGEHGKLLQGQLIDADALIPDLFAPVAQVIVDTKIKSTLQEGLAQVQQSNLPANLIKTLSPLSLNGVMSLSLGLEIPLTTKTKHGMKVRGVIEVSDATITMKEWDYPITNLSGKVSFTEDSVNAKHLSGLFLQMPAQFTLSHVKDERSEVTLSATGLIEMDTLFKTFQIPYNKIAGKTDYQAQLRLFPDNEDQGFFVLTSSLQGVVIDAPFPLAKDKDAIQPLELKAFKDNDLIHIAAKYGDNVSLACSFGLNESRLIGGHLHFGENRLAKFREDQILLIEGELPQLDFLAWKQFLTETGLSMQQDAKKSPLEPLIELKLGSFSLYGMTFDKEKIAANWDKEERQWHLAFDGADLKGIIKIPEDEHLPLVVDLHKLAIKSTLDENFSFNKTQTSQTIDIKIKELTWNNKNITDIQARLEPSWKGYFFSNVLAKIKDSEVTLSGNWDYLSPQNKVSTTGKIKIKDMAQTLNALGMKGTVQKAKGTVNFALNWNGSPAKIDFPTLGGQAEFSFVQGSIQGMNPGIGRVLSLLNLDNVRRRLNLDFSDVTKDGFSFNELNGKFQFGKGKISSNKVLLYGPSAKIEAFGQADLENQALDGEMIVMPNVTGSLPLAAAIAAGNPAIGAAVWAVDKMFGHKIQEIHRMRYKVLGTWETPKVEEVFLPVRS